MKMNDDIIYHEMRDGLGKLCVFTDTKRSQRIAKLLNYNLRDTRKSLLEKTIGYCSSLVDSQMAYEKEANNAIEKALDKTKDIKMNKTKMTRKEAIECFKKHMPAVVNPERCIDFYIEAVMLEIIEEKPIEQKVVELCHRYGYSTDFIKYLDADGLKIVEK